MDAFERGTVRLVNVFVRGSVGAGLDMCADRFVEYTQLMQEFPSIIVKHECDWLAAFVRSHEALLDAHERDMRRWCASLHMALYEAYTRAFTAAQLRVGNWIRIAEDTAVVPPIVVLLWDDILWVARHLFIPALDKLTWLDHNVEVPLLLRMLESMEERARGSTCFSHTASVHVYLRTSVAQCLTMLAAFKRPMTYGWMEELTSEQALQHLCESIRIEIPTGHNAQLVVEEPDDDLERKLDHILRDLLGPFDDMGMGEMFVICANTYTSSLEYIEPRTHRKHTEQALLTTVRTSLADEDDDRDPSQDFGEKYSGAPRRNCVLQ